MKELKKVNNEVMKEYYEATTTVIKNYRPVERKVICILDNNCVRYMTFENGKRKSRREYRNDQKETCFRNATKALNR